MSRGIKDFQFRVWKDGKIGYFDLNYWKNDYGELMTDRDNGGSCFHVCLSDYKGDMEQFTGLLDKSGRKIFEGDIVLLGGICGVIIFSDGAFCLDSKATHQAPSWFHSDRARWFEVVGNIHENPTLLEAV